jgi:hypothetical protein
VLLIGAEDSLAHTVRPRIDAAGGDASLIYSFEGVRQADGAERPPVLPWDIELLVERIQTLNVKLVIVDPLLAFLGTEFDAHKDQDVRRCLRPLRDLAEQLGITILLLRHLNKLSGGPALYRGGSSIGITGSARTSLIAGRDPDKEDRFVLAMNKTNLGPKPTSLAYRIEAAGSACRIIWDGETSLLANDILGHGGKRPGAPGENLDAAAEWLKTLLTFGPQPASVVEERGKLEGHAKRTLERAKEKAGATSRKAGKVWVWELVQGRNTANCVSGESGGLPGGLDEIPD